MKVNALLLIEGGGKTMTKDADFRNRLKLDTARPTVINWPKEVMAIADGYRNRRGVPHGVQKDAIQNGWDARVDKRRGAGWSFSFKLEQAKDGVTYLSFTDSGTTGLTGRVLQAEELEKELPPGERWGRFENVAFTKGPAEEALGSRGRGKFIFVAASKDYTILYDSLRSDGTYRFGYRTVQKTESPIVAFDEEEGAREIERLTGGFFQPLSSIGTRVIIVNPIEELVGDIESGRFLRYIGETWWEILVKYKVDITVNTYGKIEKAYPPVEFKLPKKDSRDFKIWLKENSTLAVDGGQYRIKRLHFVYRKGERVPEDMQGIAIQRGGMKVTALPMRWVSKDIAERVYGYATLERDLELAMLENEGVEHYSYDFKRVIPKALKRLLEDELATFGRRKLGLGVDPDRIERETENQAEKQAVYAINRIARKLRLAVRGFGGNGGGGGNGDRRPLRIEFVSIRFPRESRRVNYGEAITDIRVRVVNQTDNTVEGRVKLFLLRGDHTLESYLEEDILLPDKTSSEILGPFNQTFSEIDFPRKGKYTIRGKLVSLMKPRKGLVLHRLTRHFYLEEDPPETGLFEKCESLDFPKEVKLLMGEAIPGDSGGYILQYNRTHPAKRAAEDDLADLKDYLVKLMANEIPWVTIRNDAPDWFAKEKTSDGEYVARRCSQIIGQVMYEYYHG